MAYGTVTRLVETREGAEGRWEFSAPFLLLFSSKGSRCEGAEFSTLPAPIGISTTLLLALRFVVEIACVYTSSVIREFA
jgi:hypothetical protein